MPNCTATGADGGFASEKLWSNVPDARWPVFIVGFTFAILTLALYALLIRRHAVRGRGLIAAGSGAHFLPVKLVYQERMLYLGPVMIIFYVVQMCAPELATMAELFQNTYKALAYHDLMRFTSLQFGTIANAFRDDGSGTMQQHQPNKIWNKPPCCCVWVFFLPFMTPRIFSMWDARLVARLTQQYCFIGPLAAVLKMVAQYEGVAPSAVASVSLVCDLVGLASILAAVYANKVYSTIVETCPPIQHQLKQRSWFNHGQELPSDPAPNKNITPKNLWITLATVTPIIAGVIVQRVATDDLCLEDGNIIKAQNLQNYIIGFIGILLNFLAGVFAFKKAFPAAPEGDRTENLELIATRYLEYELWPAFTMENISSSINGIIEERKSKGKDVDFGVDSKLWKARMPTVPSLSEAPVQVVAETVGASEEKKERATSEI